MKNPKRSVFIVCLCAVFAVFAGSSVFVTAYADNVRPDQTIEIEAPSAILMDADTGTVVFDKNSTEHRPVASMVKIMTLLLTFEAVDSGKLSLDEDVTVSENASSMGGSQAFLDPHCEYKAEELIKAAIVASANDACVALAERQAGSVEGFVGMMNAKAKELGMNDTNFVNCTGLPAPEQYCCAHDAAIMFSELIKHDKYFDYSGIYTYDIVHPSGRTTMLTNTNKLIKYYEGCDGGKTGFTNEAMYCLSATAKRGDTRLICVVTGAASSKARNAEICKLFDIGFANYQTTQVIFKGIPLDMVYEMPESKEKKTGVAPAADGYVFTKRGDVGNVEYETSFEEVTALPLPAGSRIGSIKAIVNGEVKAECDLVTTSDLNERTFGDIFGEFAENW